MRKDEHRIEQEEGKDEQEEGRMLQLVPSDQMGSLSQAQPRSGRSRLPEKWLSSKLRYDTLVGSGA